KTREVVGTTSNLSLGGLLLLLPEKLEPGTVLGLRLGLPESTIPAEGKVIWQNSPRMADGRLPHGIQLLGFGGDAGLVGYRRYLSQISADRAV
ncbi:MAG: PilZ domain-containing protein, partial [candidate division NC10 bacterium]|nr:PilZ domain-containing protein [candidate division NC10 bacterium]